MTDTGNEALRAQFEQLRETLAEYFFNREADLAKEDDEKHGHAAQEYAHWPKDAAVQPYCRWAYREADAFLQSDIAAALTLEKDKEIERLRDDLEQSQFEVAETIDAVNRQMKRAVKAEARVAELEAELARTREQK